MRKTDRKKTPQKIFEMKETKIGMHFFNDNDFYHIPIPTGKLATI